MQYALLKSWTCFSLYQGKQILWNRLRNKWSLLWCCRGSWESQKERATPLGSDFCHPEVLPKKQFVESPYGDANIFLIKFQGSRWPLQTTRPTFGWLGRFIIGITTFKFKVWFLIPCSAFSFSFFLFLFFLFFSFSFFSFPFPFLFFSLQCTPVTFSG